MEIFFTILIMTLVVSLSGVVTRVMPFQIPLPLMQIAIGALLAFPTFGLHVEFDPELFLVLFIPPLLFADGWKTPTREFLEHGREIFGLALALVVVTVVGIGFLIYWLVPGILWCRRLRWRQCCRPPMRWRCLALSGKGAFRRKSWGFCRAKR
jgi:NhaP-type Na+/H+ or K+/H+ antiporter